MDAIEYWAECLSDAACECDLTLTSEQLKCLATGAMRGHEEYGMAYYSPPSSDRVNEIEREWKAKVQSLERQFEAYKRNAEQAVGKALRQHSDANVSIGDHGEVFRHGGRTDRIQ